MITALFSLDLLALRVPVIGAALWVALAVASRGGGGGGGPPRVAPSQGVTPRGKN